MEIKEKVISVPEAGDRYFGLGRNASYQAAMRGDLPTVRIGKRLFVPIAAVERMIDAAGERASARQASAA